MPWPKESGRVTSTHPTLLVETFLTSLRCKARVVRFTNIALELSVHSFGPGPDDMLEGRTIHVREKALRFLAAAVVQPKKATRKRWVNRTDIGVVQRKRERHAS